MPDIRSILVIGAGTMGHGIAHVAALSGYDVKLVDVEESLLTAAVDRIRRNLDKGIARGKLSEDDRDAALSRIETGVDVAAAAEGVDLCIEAVVEDLSVKRKLFATLDRSVGADAVLATNTSSLPVTKIAHGLSNPQRVIGMHFFNPVHIMKLVEIVVHPNCSDEAKAAALDVVARMKKEPVVVSDSPGFATSRLGVVLGLEAMRMVEQGVASAADIDKAMKFGYNHPMGPLELTDVVGLDVRLAVAETLHRELGGAQYEVPDVLRDKVAAGELGKKSGKGFYEWTE